MERKEKEMFWRKCEAGNVWEGDSLTPQEKALEPIKVNGKVIDLKLLDRILSIFDQRITVGEVRKVLRFLGGIP